MSKISFTGIDPSRVHRVHMWIDTKTLKSKYGLQAHIAKGQWSHLLDRNGELVLFEQESDAIDVMREWSRSGMQSNRGYP